MNSAYRPFVRCLVFAFLAGAVVLVLQGKAAATFIGDVVSCTIDSPLPESCTPSSATVVDPGAEFRLSGNTSEWFPLDVDIGPSEIRASFRASRLGSFFLVENFTIHDLDWLGSPGAITGATIVSSSAKWTWTIDGFTPDSVTASISSFPQGVFFGETLSVTIALDVTVPEPAPLVLVASGLVGVGFFACRQRWR